MSITKKKYEDLTKDSKADISKVAKKTASDLNKPKSKSKKRDSIKKVVVNQKDQSFIPIPEDPKKKALQEIDKEINDSTKISTKKDININVPGFEKIEKFAKFNKENPDVKMDAALDSLGFEKNFTNRFLFTRVKTINSLTKSEESKEHFFSQILSYGSVALFILLPFFTLFLKFFYIRKNYTYVEHLIFVFHVQTVFFMLFAIFFILKLFGVQAEQTIFILLFLLYLMIAMKQFYQQGYFKTFAKFILVNISYVIVATFGVILVFLIAFALF